MCPERRMTEADLAEKWSATRQRVIREKGVQSVASTT
jgi:hypothetical protein